MKSIMKYVIDNRLYCQLTYRRLTVDDRDINVTKTNIHSFQLVQRANKQLAFIWHIFFASQADPITLS